MKNKLPKILLTLLVITLQFPTSAFAQTTVVINEFLPNPSTGTKEWVEFHNPDSIDMTSYWVDDDKDFLSDSGSSAKKSLSTIVKTNPKYPYFELSSVLNNAGDFVVLFDQAGNIVDQYEYTQDPGIDAVIGRSPEGSGSFAILQEMTKGDGNSVPVPSPTATPTPTAIPTKEPTPTKSPTPTKTPTPTPTKSVSKTPTPTSKIKKAQTGSSPATPVVLGTNSTTQDEQPSSSDKKTLIGSASKSKAPYFSIITGSIFLVACAIIIFLKTEKN